MQDLQWFQEYEKNKREKEAHEQIMLLDGEHILYELDAAKAISIDSEQNARTYQITIPVQHTKFMQLFRNKYGERLISQLFHLIGAKIDKIEADTEATIIVFHRE
jgi:hypothetical protein